jgi:TonB family protein
MKCCVPKLSFLLLVLVLPGVCSGGAAGQKANKPLSEQEILDLIQNYVPTEKVVELVHQFGIGFEPGEQYLKSLRKAGAGKELINALRASKPVTQGAPSQPGEPVKQPEPARARDPLNQQQISTLLSNGIPGEAIGDLVAKFGISFEPTPDSLNDLRKAGANQNLLDALQKAKRLPAPAAQEKTEPKEAAQVTPEPLKQAPPPVEKKEIQTVAPAAPAQPEHTGPYQVGGEVSRPVALYTPTAPYTEQARRAHVQGTVVLAIVINEHGKVTDINVLSKPLGMGLEESAVRTVATWVFRAAQFRGVPVPVRVNIRVNFQEQN